MTAARKSATIRTWLSTTTIAAGLIVSAPATADNWTNLQGSGFSTDTSISNQTNISQHQNIVKARGDLDITENHTVNIRSGNSSSIFAAWDVEGDATHILGKLNADGRVYVFNKNGVIFGANSVVDVGGIVASTGSLTDDDIALDDGKFQFNDVDTGGKIVLDGSISVADGGLAAFVAPQVVNNGLIVANKGTVALASGNKVTLDLYGDNLIEIAVDDKSTDGKIDNSGIISAGGGKVAMSVQTAKDAVDNVINTSGIVDVTSVEVKGGKIILSGGNSGKVKVKGQLKSNGKTGGGEIKVKGKNIDVDQETVIQASATDNGSGGKVEIFADDKTVFRGNAFAKGGDNGGNGGFVEVSAKNEVGFDGYVSTAAPKGKAGQFLIDPAFSIIHSGSLNNLLGLELFLSAEALARSMEANGIVTVQADNRIDVGTDLGWIPGVGGGNIDLSQYDYDTWGVTGTYQYWLFGWHTGYNYGWINHSGTTKANLKLESNTINFNRDLKLGLGDLSVIANTVNLNSKLYDVNGLLGQGDITTTAGTVNVKSNSALIQQGVYLAKSGGTVNVGNGTYDENVTISKSLKLQSQNGRANTTINGVQSGTEQGTVYVTAGTNNVQVGDIGRGFTINGINGNGASEKAAVYLQGNQNNVKVIGNELVAKGDEAFLSEWSAVVSNLLLDNNIFSGQTFTGANPSGIGSSTQFVAGNNVPRQLVVIGGGGNTSNVTFTNNTLTGKTGGISTDDGLTNQGNYLATIDANGATITGNTFKGSTTTSASLRARGTNTQISGNTFDNAGLGGSAAHLEVKNSIFSGSEDITDIWNNNTFVGNTAVSDNSGVSNFDMIGRTIQKAVNATLSGGKVYVSDGTFDENVTINKSLTMTSKNGRGNTTINGSAGGNLGTVVIADGVNNVQIGDAGKGFTINGFDSANPGIENAALYLQGDHNGVTIKGNEIVANGDSALAAEYGRTNSNLTIDGNKFSGKTYDGASWATGNQFTVPNVPRQLIALNKGVSDVNFTNNEVTGDAGDRQLVAIEAEKANISGNTFDGLTTANALRVRGSDITVSGNAIDGNNSGTGILAENVAKLAISGNTIKSTGQGWNSTGIAILKGSDVFVFGNTLSDVGGQAIYAEGPYAGAETVLDIADNTITNAQFDGIKVVKWNGADIEGNEISNAGGNAIELELTNNSDVIGNTISGAGSAGVKLRYGNNGTKIQGNEISNSGIGIHVATEAGQSNANTIIGSFASSNPAQANKITGGTTGIFSEKSENLWVEGNEIGGASAAGINVIDGTGYSIVTYNKVDDTQDGIRLQNTAAQVSGNKIGLNGGISGYGIISNASNGTEIRSNEIGKANLDGIKVDGGDSVLVQTNKVSNTGRVGIYAANATNLTIDKNTVENSNINLPGYGAVTTDFGSNITVKRNTISGGKTGIWVNLASGANTIDSNIVDNVVEDGIRATGTTGLNITKNKIGQSAIVAGNGIVADTTIGANIESNLVKAKGTGVSASNAKDIRVMSNNIQSGSTGVRADQTKNLWVYNNDINAATNGIHVTNSAGSSYGSDDIDLWKNRITGASSAGILVENSAYATIGVHQNNQFGADGIGMGNVINGVGEGIVVKDSKNAMVRYNTVDNTNGHGISVADSASSNVWNNKVGTNGVVDSINGDGINLRNADGSVVKSNQIANTRYNGPARTGSGITVLNSDNVTIGGTAAADANAISAAGSDGIVIRADGGTADNIKVIGNKVNGTARTGLYAENVTNSTIDGNKIENTGRYASIYATGGGNNWIINNDIDNSDEIGILVDNAGGNFNIVLNNNIDFTGKAKKTSDGMNSGDAVYVRNSSNALVADNKIGVNGGSINGNGVSVGASTNAQLLSNNIKNVAKTGIRINAGNQDTQIADNVLSNIGNEGIRAEQAKNLTVQRNKLNNVSWNGIEVQGGNDAILQRNTLTNIRGNGIQLSGTNRAALTNNNVSGIRLSGIVANDAKTVSIADNLVSNVGQDAISAARNEALEVLRNFVGYTDKLGTEGAAGNIGRNGINVSRSNNAVIEDNNVVNAVSNGLQISGSDGVQVISNVITNSGARGLYASGANNGLITLVGNTFADNKVGAEFESGDIDLTVSTNTFKGGETALRFDRTIGGNSLSLVNNSIGETVFDGQSRFFVELANGAFYAPGNPGIIDGESATYNGFRPDTVPFLTVAQYNAIEGKLHHYIDENTLGLFYYGFVPGIDQSDLFRDVAGFAAGARGLSITIRGLPLVPGAASVAQTFSASSLANISPAAGDESDVANIEPAAGGDDASAEEVPVTTCWGGAVAGAVDGASVTYSMSGTMDGALADAASCEVSSL